jgi:hypothetical protein
VICPAEVVALWRDPVAALAGALLASTSALAEVSTDGTVGRRVRRVGRHVGVEADLGQVRGRNLFHSFGWLEVERGGGGWTDGRAAPRTRGRERVQDG